MNPSTYRLLASLAILSLLFSPASAQTQTGGDLQSEYPPATRTAEAAQSPQIEVSQTGLYIIRLIDPPLSAYDGDAPGLAAASTNVTGARKLDVEAPRSRVYLDYLNKRQSTFLDAVQKELGRKVEVRRQYLNALNGLALQLDASEAARLAALPGVAAIYPNRILELATDSTPQFLGATSIWDGQTGAGVSTHGEGVIIGIIDTGINQAHPSFADTDGDGYTHTNPFGSNIYKGYCISNPSFCNSKLVGAYNFYTTGASPTDIDGHGSHVAGTAAGNRHQAQFSVGAYSITETVAGIAPRANLIAYKVCNPGCPEYAILAAIDQAIADGVDVVNYSISGDDDPWNDPVSLAFLNATQAGIFVSAAAGNAGPGAGTLSNTAPWNATVAASYHERIFANELDVTGPGIVPDKLISLSALTGAVPILEDNVEGFIKYDPDNIDGCTSFAPGYFTGSLALVMRGDCNFSDKVNFTASAGALAVIIFNNTFEPLFPMAGLDPTSIPAALITRADGEALLDWIDDHTTATARLNKDVQAVHHPEWGDLMASFSSRGPSQYEILSPDFTAPGVNILAPIHASGGVDARYTFYQGTSMASPHGAGAAALMIALHPDWLPSAVHSALSSTAVFDNTRREDGVTPAIPFDRGAGRLDLLAAADAGLVFDETHANFAAANPAIGGDPKSLNLPGLVNRSCRGVCSWERTVRSVHATPSTYTASAITPSGMSITVTPDEFTIQAGETQTLGFTADVTSLPLHSWTFAEILLQPNSSSIPIQHLTLAILPAETYPALTLRPNELSLIQPPDKVATQTLTISNTGLRNLVWSIMLEESSAASYQSSTLYPLTLPVGGARTSSPAKSTSSLSAPTIVLPDSQISSTGMDWSEGFDNTTTLPANGWAMINRSSPLGSTSWFQGNVSSFTAQSGGGNSYIGANYANTSGIGTISNWLLTPEILLKNGDTVSFYTRSAYILYPDRLELRLSLAGASTDVGNTAYGVGDFSDLLLSINPNLQADGYPISWTKYTSTLIGIPTPTSGRLAFRYYVTNGGPHGINSNYIGIDTFQYQSACNPDDIPWLSVSPLNGETTPNSSDDVTVTFDSNGIEAGTYAGRLCVSSNDPELPLVVIPVTMTVESMPYGVVLLPSDVAKSGLPGDSVQYALTLTNTGNTTDSYNISADGNSWPTNLVSTVGPLVSGASTTINVYVTIPTDVAIETGDTASITAVSQGDGSRSAVSSLTTTADFVHDCDLSPTAENRSGAPGETVTYTLRITNTGNATDTFRLEAYPGLWSFELPDPLPLPPGAGADAAIQVHIPPGAQHNDQFVLTITVALNGIHSALRQSVLTTTAIIPPPAIKLFLPVVLNRRY